MIKVLFKNHIKTILKLKYLRINNKLAKKKT